MHPFMSFVLLMNSYVRDSTFKYATIGTIVAMMFSVYVLLAIADVVLDPNFIYEQ